MKESELLINKEGQITFDLGSEHQASEDLKLFLDDDIKNAYWRGINTGTLYQDAPEGYEHMGDWIIEYYRPREFSIDEFERVHEEAKKAIYEQKKLKQKRQNIARAAIEEATQKEEDSSEDNKKEPWYNTDRFL